MELIIHYLDTIHQFTNNLLCLNTNAFRRACYARAAFNTIQLCHCGSSKVNTICSEISNVDWHSSLLRLYCRLYSIPSMRIPSRMFILSYRTNRTLHLHNIYGSLIDCRLRVTEYNVKLLAITDSLGHFKGSLCSN